jgi:hypothetical protein
VGSPSILPTPRRNSRRHGRIRAGLSEAEIGHAQRVAEISAEALVRYDLVAERGLGYPYLNKGPAALGERSRA